MSVTTALSDGSGDEKRKGTGKGWSNKAIKIEICDVTLRDGAQSANFNPTLDDKLHYVHLIAEHGLAHVIECGWPGSNPKDKTFFKEARKLSLPNDVRLAAFGSTRHAKKKPEEDPNLRALVESEVPVVNLFGKSWDKHVTDALRVELETNLEMIEDSIAFLVKHGIEVNFDAEHFFDGYLSSPDYASSTLMAAVNGGASSLVLCDTNGGTDTIGVSRITGGIAFMCGGNNDIGIHCHNDGGMAIANTIAAVQDGAVHVQGTMNGFGERTGNADLTAILPWIDLKLEGYSAIGAKACQDLTQVSRHIYEEIANMEPPENQPFVGRNSFTHKGGIHVSAINRGGGVMYEHIPPKTIGNHRRIVISDLAGRANIKALGYNLDDETERAVLAEIERMENEGYTFSGNEASYELLVKRIAEGFEGFFSVDAFEVGSRNKGGNSETFSEAIVKISILGLDKQIHVVADSKEGPVDALDHALRKALENRFTELRKMHLADYKVHILNSRNGTGAKTRVLITSANDGETWRTVGVSKNIIEASLQALVDSYTYWILQSNK